MTRYAGSFYVLLGYVCFYADMYAYYAVGRKAICYGPEGNMLWAGRHCVMGRKAICFRPEGRGPEGRICGWYIGGISLSFRASSCGFVFSGSQESVARQRRDCTVPRIGVL